MTTLTTEETGAAKQQQIQTERHSHRFGRLCSHRPINRKQDVVNGGSVEVGSGGDEAPIDEREGARECLDGSGHSIAAPAAKLCKILRSGKGDQEASVVAQDTPEFARIHPRRDRQDAGLTSSTTKLGI